MLVGGVNINENIGAGNVGGVAINDDSILKSGHNESIIHHHLLNDISAFQNLENKKEQFILRDSKGGQFFS